MAPENVRNNPPAKQRSKRRNASFGEEEGSFPKRPRPSPSGGDHPNPPGAPQNQPPMASRDPFNPQQGGGPAGPQNMRRGMVHPPMNVAYQSTAGFAGPPMRPGKGSIPNPTMMNSWAPMIPVRFFTSWTGWRLFLLVDGQLQTVNAKTPPQGNGATSDWHQCGVPAV